MEGQTSLQILNLALKIIHHRFQVIEAQEPKVSRLFLHILDTFFNFFFCRLTKNNFAVFPFLEKIQLTSKFIENKSHALFLKRFGLRNAE